MWWYWGVGSEGTRGTHVCVVCTGTRGHPCLCSVHGGKGTPVSIQRQDDGWGFEKAGLEGGVPAYSRGIGTR